MPKITFLLLTAAAGAMLGACGGETTEGKSPTEMISSGDVLVFESRQTIQCGSRGLTTQQSAQKLVNSGIDVLESNCGVNTGVAFATLCGLGNWRHTHSQDPQFESRRCRATGLQFRGHLA